MGVVYVKKDCVVAWSRGQSPLSKGDAWDDQAPLVRERPELFAAEPTLVRGRPARPEVVEDQEQAAESKEQPEVVDERQEQPVVTATADPGTKRTTAAKPRAKRKA